MRGKGLSYAPLPESPAAEKKAVDAARGRRFIMGMRSEAVLLAKSVADALWPLSQLARGRGAF